MVRPVHRVATLPPNEYRAPVLGIARAEYIVTCTTIQRVAIAHGRQRVVAFHTKERLSLVPSPRENIIPRRSQVARLQSQRHQLACTPDRSIGKYGLLDVVMVQTGKPVLDRDLVSRLTCHVHHQVIALAACTNVSYCNTSSEPQRIGVGVAV